MAFKKIASTAVGLIVWACAAHVASMLCYAIYPTLLPQLQPEWGASNSTAGLFSGLPWYAIVGFSFVMLSLHMGDSSALTTGMVVNSDPIMRGASMALHSMLGFGAGFIAPLAFGAVLDATGGNASPGAWMFAYASLGLLGVFAPLILKLR